MVSLQFIGSVQPPGSRISINFSYGISWEDEGGLSVSIRPNIQNNAVVIDCEVSEFYQNNGMFMGNLYAKVLAQAQFVVDLMGFAYGTGLTVVLTHIKLPDGSTSEILLNHPDLPPLCTAFSPQADMGSVLADVVSDPTLGLALNDLTRALSTPHYAAVACGRVADAIRHVIAGPGVEASEGWKRTREALNVDRTYITLVTAESTRPRHGERLAPSTADSQVVIRRAWTLMDRLLEYRKQGGSPLTEPNFPLLQG